MDYYYSKESQNFSVNKFNIQQKKAMDAVVLEKEDFFCESSLFDAKTVLSYNMYK